MKKWPGLIFISEEYIFLRRCLLLRKDKLTVCPSGQFFPAIFHSVSK
ncbi:Uncharacterized protein dnm_041220 [Desulfonema magnum]|uniref:Uncharacterized protein n=1 Tax=Desulfonema magnum TaxID=45655 RepID=A0A975BM75_9BACT|nr:Uncharacterized protein dnm_041220 [Desulfonema magnum]